MEMKKSQMKLKEKKRIDLLSIAGVTQSGICVDITKDNIDNCFTNFICYKIKNAVQLKYYMYNSKYYYHIMFIVLFGGILYILTALTMKSTKATRSKKKF